MGSKEIALLRWVIILIGFLVGLTFNIEVNVIFGLTLIFVVLTGFLEKE
jgi:hypothetical protein